MKQLGIEFNQIKVQYQHMSESFRTLSLQYGSGKGLESISDDYIDSFKMQINSMKE